MLAAAERWGGGEDERPYLPRAFSVARVLDGEAHFLLEDVGPGTHRLCELQTGEGLWVLGPLGRRLHAPRRRSPRAACRRRGRDRPAGDPAGLARPGRSELWLLGFRDAAHAVGAALLRDALVATDDGSVGHHGLVTDLLAAELDRDAHAVVYACGPAPMLEAVRALCAARAVPAQLALEAGMACGFGACLWLRRVPRAGAATCACASTAR